MDHWKVESNIIGVKQELVDLRRQQHVVAKQLGNMERGGGTSL